MAKIINMNPPFLEDFQEDGDANNEHRNDVHSTSFTKYRCFCCCFCWCSFQVLPWLNDQEDAKILGEMWAVLGMSGPLPRQTKDALAALKDTFKHMETAAGSK